MGWRLVTASLDWLLASGPAVFVAGLQETRVLLETISDATFAQCRSTRVPLPARLA
jgi:hypothetical protein